MNNRLTNQSVDHDRANSVVSVDALSSRIKNVIGDETVASFARKSGLGDSLIRKYLAGAQPNTANLVAIASAGGVSIEWLATGKGDKFKNPTSKANAVIASDSRNQRIPPTQHNKSITYTESDAPDSSVESVGFSKSESDAVSLRIRQVIGDEYVTQFGRRCGLSEAVLRSYTNDSRMPPLDKAAAIAAAGNVSIEWLATGRGQRERVPSGAPQPAPDNEAGEIAHIYSQATEPQRRAFRALANAVRNPSLRAWLDLGIAVGEAADLTPAPRTQTQKKEP